MSEEKKNDILVNLVKKAVGLPTGNSSCCGAVPAAAVQPVPAQSAQSTSSGEVAAPAGDRDKGRESGGCCG